MGTGELSNTSKTGMKLVSGMNQPLVFQLILARNVADLTSSKYKLIMPKYETLRIGNL